MAKGRVARRNLLSVGGTMALGMFAGGLPGARRAFAADQAGLPAHIINPGGDPTLVCQELIVQQGYLKEMGLDATTDVVSDGSKLMGALFNGSEDISVLSGFSQVFPAIEKGGKMKILAGTGLLAQLTVYSKKPEIKTVKDLEGKTVGTGSLGALLHQLMIALLQKKGVDTSSVKFVNIGSTSDVLRAVVAGTVDAGPANFDVFNQQDKYGIHALEESEMWEQIPEYTYQGAYATDAAIAKRRDVLVRVLAAYAKAFRFIQSPDSKDAYTNAWLSVFKGTNPGQMKIEAGNQWDFFQKYKPFAVNLAIGQDRIDYMQKLNVTLGIQKTVLPFAEVADMSLAEDAVKLIGRKAG